VPETPEARAALEARLREIANSIGDGSVRRHYSQAFEEKLEAFFGGRGDRFERRDRRDGRGGGRYGGNYAGRGRNPRVVVSESLRNSRLMKPGRSADMTAREAAILLSLVNHPALAEHRIEQLAELELDSPAARSILAAVIDEVTRDHAIEGKVLHERLVARGLGELLVRMEVLLARQGIWQSGADIAEVDAETGLKHALALHYKSVQLNKELKAAEMALGDDPSEETFERLRDIQNQITSVDGTEALIEGFGSLSGRATRSF